MTHEVAGFAAKFRKDGFVLVPRFLEPAEVDELDRQIQRYTEQVLPTMPRVHVFYESGSSGPLKHLSRFERYDDYFNRFLGRLAANELLVACMGSRLEPITTELFFKLAHVGSAATYHQDNAYFNYDPPEGLVVWIALDETTVENGAVHFARGSHRLGNLEHDETGLPLFGKALAEPPDPQRYPEVPALLRRGDASIHHFLTVHRSGPNHTDHNRRGFVLNFRGEHAEIDQAAHAAQEAYKQKIYKQSEAV